MGGGANWVVCRGTGYVGHILCIILALTVVLFIIDCYKEVADCRLLACTIGMPWLGAISFFFASTIWYDWSFRYVAGYVLVLLFFFIGRNCIELEKRNIGKIIICLIWILSVFNVEEVFRNGQAHPYKFEEAQNLSSTEKKLSFSSLAKSDDLCVIPELMEILENGGRGLLFDTFSYPYYHFFGDNNCVYIDLVDNKQKLMEQAFEKEYDFYVICTSLSDCENYQEVKDFFAEYGYGSYNTTSGLVFMKNSNI